MQELADNIKAVVALDYAAAVAATAAGTTIDTQGFSKITFLVHLHKVTTADATNYFTVTVKEGDASNLSDGVAVSSASPSRYVGADPADRLINDAGADNTIMRIGVRTGTKRYMGLVLTATGTVSVDCSGMAILGGPRHAPVAQ